MDAITGATDAVTGASQILETAAVSGDFGVAYAVNGDGSLFLQARDLVDAYNRDELASDSVFKNQILVIRGEVENASKPGAARPWITLVGEGEPGKKIRCSLLDAGASADTVQTGSVVQIRGRCDGMKFNITIAEAQILE